MLWFAWKIVLLQYHKHQLHIEHVSYFSCDLLEKSYFCSITNIFRKKTGGVSFVVICLKNRTFAVSQTSIKKSKRIKITLWFAWKIVLLQYHKHPLISSIEILGCCDLLEKSYFCSITNIILLYIVRPRAVVICLKNRTFAVSQTSKVTAQSSCGRLWFAWKIVLLQYHKHQAG